MVNVILTPVSTFRALFNTIRNNVNALKRSLPQCLFVYYYYYFWLFFFLISRCTYLIRIKRAFSFRVNFIRLLVQWLMRAMNLFFRRTRSCKRSPVLITDAEHVLPPASREFIPYLFLNHRASPCWGIGEVIKLQRTAHF